MKKSITAVLIALLMTAIVGLSMFAIGTAALSNQKGVAVSNSPAQASAPAGLDPQQSSNVAELQNLVTQYQGREQQYRQREQQLEDQLAQAKTQIQQDQQTLQQVQTLLGALQQRGLISISNDGRVFIRQ
jgi:peptidoglycan hydrolase CwlO-like protein